MSKHAVYDVGDGSVVIEGRADEFSKEWRAAPLHDRLVMPDGRPAVRQATELGPILFMMYPAAWDRLKKLPRGRLIICNRTKLCELCGTELRMVRELETMWCFRCPSCRSVESHSKDLVGGTLGAGEKEKV